MSNDYEVGYKKPPKATQFKKGKSGNPKGRPKEARNLRTDFEAELAERIFVSEGGCRKAISKLRAMMKALVAKALQGDIRACGLVFKQVEKFAALPEKESTSEGRELSRFAWTEEDESLIPFLEGLSEGRSRIVLDDCPDEHPKPGDSHSAGDEGSPAAPPDGAKG
jgi:hypothetical protein